MFKTAKYKIEFAGSISKFQTYSIKCAITHFTVSVLLSLNCRQIEMMQHPPEQEKEEMLSE